MLQVVNHPCRLYNYELATYDSKDEFDHDAAAGFIALYGLQQRVQAKTQLSKGDTHMLPAFSDLRVE